MEPVPDDDMPDETLVGVERTEGRLTSSEGVEVFWQGWLPETPSRGVVVLAHGGLEHGGRYAHVARRMTGAGMPAYIADFRGHGRSGGRPGQIGRMARLVDDLHLIVELARERHPGQPVFLVAHSLGAMVALEYVLSEKRALTGVVLSGTGIDVSAIPKAQVLVARLLSSIAPNFGLVRFSGDDVSRDPAVVHAYQTDPLIFHGKVPVRTPAELLVSADRVIPRLSEVTVPLRVVHGGADVVASPAGARQVHDRASSNDKSINVYDGLFHEIFNEPEQDQVIDDVVSWITARV